MFDSVLNMPRVLNIHKGFEYASSSKYARVLNIPFSKYKKVPFAENYKKLFQSRLFKKKIYKIFLGKSFEG